METWVLMWMLMQEADGNRTRYEPRSQEVVGTKADCEEVGRQLRIYYISQGIKYGNVYCVPKDDE